MPLKYYEIEDKDIKEYIESKEFKKFKEKISKNLNITNIKYEVEIEDIKYDDVGYEKIKTSASTIFNEKYSEIKEVIFYTEGIKEISKKFGKLFRDKNISEQVKEIIIKVALVHELIHIQQFNNGIINQEYMEKEMKKDYREREIEIEAEKKSYEIVEAEGEIEKIIIDYLKNNKSILNCDVDRISKLLNKE